MTMLTALEAARRFPDRSYIGVQEPQHTFVGSKFRGDFNKMGSELVCELEIKGEVHLFVVPQTEVKGRRSLTSALFEVLRSRSPGYWTVRLINDQQLVAA